MISIDNYEIINNADGSQVFKLDYSSKINTPIRLRIVMQDLLFKTCNYNIDYLQSYLKCNSHSVLTPSG